MAQCFFLTSPHSVNFTLVEIEKLSSRKKDTFFEKNFGLFIRNTVKWLEFLNDDKLIGNPIFVCRYFNVTTECL